MILIKLHIYHITILNIDFHQYCIILVKCRICGSFMCIALMLCVLLDNCTPDYNNLEHRERMTIARSALTTQHAAYILSAPITIKILQPGNWRGRTMMIIRTVIGWILNYCNCNTWHSFCEVVWWSILV